MAVMAKAKENPMMAGAVTIAILAAGVTGIVQMWGVLDRTHTTEAELLVYDSQPHSVHVAQFEALESAISEIEIKSKCRWLDGQIRALEDSIYVRKRDGADPDSIHDLEVALERLQDQYDILICQLKLA